MISALSHISSPTKSFIVNSNIQGSLYKWLDAEMDSIKWVRISTFGLYGVSSIVTLATRVASVAEVLLKGVIHITSSSFYGEETFNSGIKNVFIQFPKEILKTVCFPLEFLLDCAIIASDPKYFVIFVSEFSAVFKKHAKSGSLESEEFHKDIRRAYANIHVKNVRSNAKDMRK